MSVRGPPGHTYMCDRLVSRGTSDRDLYLVTPNIWPLRFFIVHLYSRKRKIDRNFVLAGDTACIKGSPVAREIINFYRSKYSMYQL